MTRKEDFRFITTTPEGIRTDCAFYQPSIDDCIALSNYYNLGYGRRCYKCSFFKTKEQYNKDKLKYGEWKGLKDE